MQHTETLETRYDIYMHHITSIHTYLFKKIKTIFNVFIETGEYLELRMSARDEADNLCILHLLYCYVTDFPLRLSNPKTNKKKGNEDFPEFRVISPPFILGFILLFRDFATCASFHLHSGSSMGQIIPTPLMGLYGCASGRNPGGAFPYPAPMRGGLHILYI